MHVPYIFLYNLSDLWYGFEVAKPISKMQNTIPAFKETKKYLF